MKDSDIKQNSFNGHADISFTRGYIAYVLSLSYIVAIATQLHDDGHNDDNDTTNYYTFYGIV